MIPWLQAVPGMLDFVIVLDSVFVCVFPSMFMIRCMASSFMTTSVVLYLGFGVIFYDSVMPRAFVIRLLYH